MLRRRFGTFSGGIDLPDDKGATLDAPIAAGGALRRLLVPLAPVEGPPAAPVVRAGQRVRRGELIARGDTGRQVHVFAPLSGRVAGFADAALPATGTGWRAATAVEMDELEPQPGIADLPGDDGWRDEAPDGLGRRIAEGGLTTCRQAAGPLAGWVRAARGAGVDTLIANVMENTPYVTADHRLLAERGPEVAGGLAILARAIEARRAMLAVDRRRTDAYRAAVGPVRSHGIDAIALAHKYPIGADAILVKVLTRRVVPAGGRPFDVRVAVTDAATCWLTYRRLACGEPAVARVVTVAGEAVERAGNLLLPFGAEVSEVLAAAGAGDHAGVYGPAMTGRRAAAGAVVGPTADALLVLGRADAAPPTPCIRCGWCGERCPARLNVAALNDDFELGRAARAERRGVLACVGCGICTYICPARLPLAQRTAALKRAIAERREAHAHAGPPQPQPAG